MFEFNIFKKVGEPGGLRPEQQLTLNREGNSNPEQELAHKQTQFEDLLIARGVAPELDGSFPLENLVKLIKGEIEKEVATCGSNVEYCDQMSAALAALTNGINSPEDFIAVVKTISPKTENALLKTALDIANQ